MVDNGCIRERRKIRRSSILGSRANETNEARCDCRDEQLVVGHRWPRSSGQIELIFDSLRPTFLQHTGLSRHVSSSSLRRRHLRHRRISNSAPWSS